MYEVIDDTFHPLCRVTLDSKWFKTVNPGEVFEFGGSNWFHSVAATGLTITAITRTEFSAGTCQVIAPDGDPPQNAFDPEKAPPLEEMRSEVMRAFSYATAQVRRG